MAAACWRLRNLGLVAALATMVACASGGPLTRLTRESSPYEQYVDGLRDAGLDATALGRDWLAAGERALTTAAPATLPLAESGYFEAANPSATAWRVDVARGRRLVIDVRLDAPAAARLFVDVFAAATAGVPERVASLAPDATSLTYEPDRDGSYVIRVQPELLRGGRYTVTQRTLASLAFPVQGLTARAVQSGFGADRDAGRRTHDGIDIFAPRGTPVLAVAAGLARPDTNTLGGNVVWLHQPTAGRTFYYAHLERWAFEDQRFVAAGDVLGYVGNTGNARTTGPHLHFGIYSRGAIDPAPFVRQDDALPDAPSGPLLGARARVTAARAALREGPAPAATALRTLPRDTLALVVGAERRSYRLRLPDGTTGYIDRSVLTTATMALGKRRVTVGTIVRDAPHPTASVVTTAEVAREVDVLGRYDAYAWVRDETGTTGWIDVSPAAAPTLRR